MDLESFVRESLLQITRGIDAARSKDIRICPELAMERIPKIDGKGEPWGDWKLSSENLSRGGLLETIRHKPADLFEFDVAVTIDSATTSSLEGNADLKGKASVIAVASAEINADVSKKSAKENSSSKVTRIKFRIPVQLGLP